MALKIIHCADIHFDSAMSGISDRTKVNIRREDMKKTFQKIISLAGCADVLLIAGDLFDAKKVSASTLEFIKDEFSKIPDTDIFIVAGNHDFMSESGVYKTFHFGKNVHVFGTDMERVEKDEYNIYGISFKTANDEREMLRQLSLTASDKINICLMHGNVSGNHYNPIKISDIEASGLDYLALGHIHKASELKKAGKTFYAYPGSPEGRGNDETGPKGVYSIELLQGVVSKCEFVPVCTRMYIDEEVDVSGVKTYDEIIQTINKHYVGDEHFYRFTLVGATDMVIDSEVVESMLSGFSVTVREKTKTSLNLEKLSGDFSLKGLFFKYALSEKEGLTEEEFNDAVKAGLYYIEKEENNEN